jgi:hypothetical protein
LVGWLQVLIDRKKWIDLAEECEKADAPLTCASIIRAVIGLGVEKEDRKRTWLADAEVSTQYNCCRVVSFVVCCVCTACRVCTGCYAYAVCWLAGGVFAMCGVGLCG